MEKEGEEEREVREKDRWCGRDSGDEEMATSRLVALFLSSSSSSLPSLLLPSSASTPRRLYRPPLSD